MLKAYVQGLAAVLSVATGGDGGSFFGPKHPTFGKDITVRPGPREGNGG